MQGTLAVGASCAQICKRSGQEMNRIENACRSRTKFLVVKSGWSSTHGTNIFSRWCCHRDAVPEDTILNTLLTFQCAVLEHLTCSLNRSPGYLYNPHCGRSCKFVGAWAAIQELQSAEHAPCAHCIARCHCNLGLVQQKELWLQRRALVAE